MRHCLTGVRAVPYYDQGLLVQRAAATVTTALWQGAILVAIIVFLFLGGWRPSLVVVLSIPFSVGFAFIAMNLLGMSANLMSLGGVRHSHRHDGRWRNCHYREC